MNPLINDPSATPEERVAALRSHAAETTFVEMCGESNNHIHTCYSFSPYTPAAAALRGREAGLTVVGSVDHDSYAGADEMRQACGILGLGCVTGIELRTFLHTAEDEDAGRAPFAKRKINSPDSLGIAYLTIQAVPASATDAMRVFCEPIRTARRERTRRMADRANTIFRQLGVAQFDFEADVVGISQYDNGGTITERHLLDAMAKTLISSFGKGIRLLAGLEKMGIVVSESVAKKLSDLENPHLEYDLLGLMKAEFLERIYEQPKRISEGGECYDAGDVVRFAEEIGAICAYPYLGDVTASATGDKAAEKFEDEYLNDLMPVLADTGFKSLAYMPPRNTRAQLARIMELADEWGMLQISGVDINTPRQSFNCPELRESEFAHLNDSTWALVAHELLADVDVRFGLLSDDGPVAGLPLTERIHAYAKLGRAIVAKQITVLEAVTQLQKGGKL